MSHCIIPKWNSRHHQRQDQEIQIGEERNSSRSHQSHQNLSTYVVPMSNNCEVGEELTWESREQPAIALMHGGHGGIIGTGLTPQTKPHTWSITGDTLESIVHQATFSDSNHTISQQRNHDRERVLKYSTSMLMPTSSCEKWRENTITATSQQMQVETNDEYNGMKMRSNTNYMPSMPYTCGGLRINSMGTEGINRVENSGLDVVIKKRVRSDNCGKNSFNDQLVEERTSCAGAGAGASAGANNITDTTMMSTWTSFDSSPSQTFKRTATINTPQYHSHSRHCTENQDDENKGESLRSQSSTRRNRAAVVHNQSERRRRDRINEKMMALQKLVPNASKTDKASMLDEVIEYLKQLQAQVNMLSNARTIPQMVMPFGMQQLQMSILGRMGMGMGMLDHVNLNFPRNMPQSFPPLLHGTPPTLGTTTTPSFVPPPFSLPSLVPPLISTSTPLKPNIDSTCTTIIPNFTDAYGTFLAQQSMNMDFLNKMSALYRQQVNQSSKKPNSLSHPNNVQGDQ